MNTKKMKQFLGVTILGSTVTMSGCAHKMKFTTEPSGAVLKIDNQVIGETPVEHSFSVTTDDHYKLKYSKEGFHNMERVLTGPTVKNIGGYFFAGGVHQKLIKDQAWNATISSDVANRWIRIQVNEKYDAKKAWQVIVMAVTGVFDDLENMDSESGYLKTAKKKRNYQGISGGYSITSHVITNIEQKNPLKIRVKLVMKKVDSKGNSTDYNRVYSNDVELLETIQATLK